MDICCILNYCSTVWFNQGAKKRRPKKQRQTIRTVTVQSLIEVQNQLQPTYLVHKRFEKIISHTPINASKLHFEGWVVGLLWKTFKGKSCDSSFERSLYPHNFGKISFDYGTINRVEM